jgi:hypothetical protein
MGDFNWNETEEGDDLMYITGKVSHFDFFFFLLQLR